MASTTRTPTYPTQPFVRAFKLLLENPTPTPDGGQTFQIPLNPEHFTHEAYEARSTGKALIKNLRLFVNGEWGNNKGGASTVHHYVFYKNKKWHLYNSMVNTSLTVNIIAVPGEMTEEEYYSVAIFTHKATTQNTFVPLLDKVTGPKYKYVSYMDDARLNGRPELMLLISRLVMGSRLPPTTDLHHFTVWYDPESEYTAPDRVGSLPKGRWAIAYTSRNAIKAGTCFNMMAMGTDEEEHHYEEEAYLPSAFAFEHDVNKEGSSTVLSTNENTTLLDKALTEKLLEQLKEYNEKRDDFKHLGPGIGLDLIVLATERWDGPVYTEAIINRLFKGEEREMMLREKINTFRNEAEFNVHTPAVWYIDRNYRWNGNFPRPDEVDKWAIFINLNGPIKLIKLNICTRLPCPKWCNG